jgi:hypothetical protein
MSKPYFALDEKTLTPDYSPALQVFVAYESAGSCFQGSNFCRFLTEDLGRGLDLESTFFSLDVLAGQQDRQETIEAVAQADIVVFAMNTDSRLRPEVIYWIESWIPLQLARTGGLLILIENGGKSRRAPSFMENYLDGVARRAGMNFLLQRLDAAAAPGRGAPAKTEEPILAELSLSATP